MAYKIFFTSTGQETHDKCIDYVLFKLESLQAARSLMSDVEKIMEILQTNAKSFAPCEDKDLQRLGLRKIHLQHHNYKIFYSIDQDTVYIEYILHDLQDPKNNIK